MGSLVIPQYLGDFSSGQTVCLVWSSFNSSGASVAPTGTPTVKVYKDSSTTEESSVGVSSFSFDTITGINHVAINTGSNASFYTPNSDYFVVLDSLTLDSQTVRTCIGQFSIENRTSVAPMIRGKLASSTSGASVLDSSAVAVANTYIGNIIRIVSGTGAGQSRVIYAYSSGRSASVTPNWTTTPDSTSYYQILPVGSTDVVSINSSSTVTLSSAVNANVIQIDGANTSTNSATLNLKQLNIVNSAGSAIIASSTGSNGDGVRATAHGSGKDINATTNTIVGNIAGNLSGSVGSVTSGVTVTTNNDKSGYTLSASGVDAVWDEAQSGHVTAGTFGKYLDSSISGVSTGGVSAADIADAVWDEARSGHITAGTFGQGVASVTGSVGSVTGAVGSVTGSVGGSVGSVTGNVGGNVTGSVGSVVGDVGGNLTGSVGSVVGAVGSVTGNVGGSVGSVTGNIGGNVAGSVGSVTGGVGGSVTGSVASVVGNVGGNVVGSVGSVAGSVSGNLGGNIGGSVESFGTTAITSIKSAVWDEAISSHTTTGTTGSTIQPVYFADISFLKDDTDTKDEYTVTWFKSGIPVLTGITNANIRVIRRSTGGDIVTNTNLTEVAASTGIYKYDSTSSNRITVGDSFIIVVTATIDGSTRTFRKIQGRDN